MSGGQARTHELCDRLAALLRYGTWLACAAIGLGLLLSGLDGRALAGIGAAPGSSALSAGVVLFILLPVARVALVTGVLLRQRDYALGALALLVLALLALGAALGFYLPSFAAGHAA